MIYIIDMTLGWNKDRERITSRELLEGKRLNKGANVQNTSAARAIKSLTKKGVIQVLNNSKRNGSLIRVNLEWSLDEYENGAYSDNNSQKT
jgi:hypothetical protein